jgi:hypothetical protein
MVFKEVSNKNFKNDNVPSILKPYLVSRKFVVNKNGSSTTLQFGSGQQGASDVVANPQSVAMESFGKTYTTALTFDPTRLSNNKSLGIVPQNTTLIVTLRATNPTNSNLAVGELTNVVSSALQFKDRSILSNDVINQMQSSLEVSNEEPITGDVTNPNSAEVKQRIFDTFPTQNRAVTQADYENLTYRMPAKFGSIKRVSAQRDPDSQKRNLNLYVLSEDSFGKLIKTNSTIKNNLKKWLNEYRMINDTIDILDPYIINLGINFSIKTITGADKFTTLNRCVTKLSNFYESGFFIGESMTISDIYQQLKNVRGVLDVVNVNIVTKTGANYSGAEIQINKNLSPDGEQLLCPKNAIFEIKFPSVDIKGKVR